MWEIVGLKYPVFGKPGEYEGGILCSAGWLGNESINELRGGDATGTAPKRLLTDIKQTELC